MSRGEGAGRDGGDRPRERQAGTLNRGQKLLRTQTIALGHDVGMMTYKTIGQIYWSRKV